MLRERLQPKDVLVQQQKVAQALAFIAPVHFLRFPAIMKRWLDRVWTPGFAYDLPPEAWGGDISGLIATHIQPPGMAGLGQEYDPYATPNFAGDETLAKAEMAQSEYDTNGDGLCDAPECTPRASIAL